MKFEPFDYQREAIQFLLDTPRAALHIDVGMGKTAIALSVVNELLQTFEVARVLVIAPINVIYNTFPDELGKWDQFQWIRFVKLHGQDKVELVSSTAPVHLLNYEGIAWMGNTLKDWSTRYDMVVMDESHWVKDPSTMRFKWLSATTVKVPRMLLMTGTPVGNSLLDLWAQYFLLDRGARLGGSMYQFKTSWFRATGYQGYTMEPLPETEEHLTRLVSDITFTVKRPEGSLVDKTESVLPVELDEEDLDNYKKFERDYLLELDEQDEPIEAFNAATLANKLRQYANGFVYGEDETGARIVVSIHDRKIERLMELLDAAEDPVMVVCTFVEDFRMIRKALGYGVPSIFGETTKAMTRKHIKNWNAGRYPVMLIHPRSVGVGVNLQHGGCRQVWLSPDWSYLSKTQAVGRIWRTGQEKPVTIEIMVAEGTIDEMIMEALEEKENTAKQFARRLRRYVKKRKRCLV